MAGEWLDGLTRCRADGLAHVLVTVLEIKGSAPREPGAKMVVHAQGQAGSIGGGNLEYEAADTARQMITERKYAPEQRSYHLGADMVQCCGGGVVLLFEPFLATGFDIALFGAGHVGSALVRVLSGTQARIHWIDSRAELLDGQAGTHVFPRISDDPAKDVAALPANSYALVMTHQHQTDFELIRALLDRTDLAYIGLIGSKTKWARFKNRLRKDGITDRDMDRVHSPIGLPDLPGKAPAEIAIAVAADLLRRDAASRIASLPTDERDGTAA